MHEVPKALAHRRAFSFKQPPDTSVRRGQPRDIPPYAKREVAPSTLDHRAEPPPHASQQSRMQAAGSTCAQDHAVASAGRQHAQPPSHAKAPATRELTIEQVPEALAHRLALRLEHSHITCQACQPRDSCGSISEEALWTCGHPEEQHWRQPARPEESLRYIMWPMPLRSFCMKAARSAAISIHAPQPRDRPRCSKWRRLRCIDARFRAAETQMACHAFQPRDSSRFIGSSALATSGRREELCEFATSEADGELAVHHETHALRSFCMKMARSIAISTSAPHPRDRPRCNMWLDTLHRRALRATAAQMACHAFQPRDSSRFTK